MAKQSNQKRMKMVTIIANEEQYKLAPFIKKCSTGHRETMIEFIYETGVNASSENIFKLSSQELAFELVEQGFCVLLYNNQMDPASLTVYLPEKLSVSQRQYLEMATSMLMQCNLTVFKLDSNEACIDYQNEASQSVEAFASYIKTLSKYDDVTNEKVSSNSLVKAPKIVKSTNEGKNS